MKTRLTAQISRLAIGGRQPSLLEHASLTLNGGEITCLVGPSGAGKSALLRLLAGDTTLSFGGRILYQADGRAACVLEAAQLGWLGLFLPDTGLPPWLSVSEIFLLPSRLNPRLARPDSTAITETLKRLSLPRDSVVKKPHELSLGMRHRVLLALALLYRPRFLFIDELLSSIDSPTVDSIVPVLRKFVEEQGAVCLLTTHDLDRALTLGGRLYYKSLGIDLRVLANATVDDVTTLFREDLNAFRSGRPR